jgi:hypothetical protein
VLYNSLREQRDTAKAQQCIGELAACDADLQETRPASPACKASTPPSRSRLRRAGGRGPREGRPQPRRRADPVRRRPLLQRPQGPRRGLPRQRAGVRRRRPRPAHRPLLQLQPARTGFQPGSLSCQGEGAGTSGGPPAQRGAGDGPVLPRHRRPRHPHRPDHLPPLPHRQVDAHAPAATSRPATPTPATPRETSREQQGPGPRQARRHHPFSARPQPHRTRDILRVSPAPAYIPGGAGLGVSLRF